MEGDSEVVAAVGSQDKDGLELAVTLGLEEIEGGSEMDGNCEGEDVGCVLEGSSLGATELEGSLELWEGPALGAMLDGDSLTSKVGMDVSGIGIRVGEAVGMKGNVGILVSATGLMDSPPPPE